MPLFTFTRSLVHSEADLPNVFQAPMKTYKRRLKYVLREHQRSLSNTLPTSRNSDMSAPPENVPARRQARRRISRPPRPRDPRVHRPHSPAYPPTMQNVIGAVQYCRDVDRSVRKSLDHLNITFLNISTLIFTRQCPHQSLHSRGCV